MNASSLQETGFAKLRGFLQADPEPVTRPETAGAECELCSVPLHSEHRHLLEMSSREVVCSCDGCALRFQNLVDGRFKLVPRDARALPGFRMSDAQWAALDVPINLAFIVHDSVAETRRALYPSPAGVTESLLTLSAWSELAEENAILREMEDDVEALLVNRLNDGPSYYLAPIDDCYELAGLIRVHWKGLSGGEEVWDAVTGFFDRLKKHARHA